MRVLESMENKGIQRKHQNNRNGQERTGMTANGREQDLVPPSVFWLGVNSAVRTGEHGWKDVIAKGFIERPLDVFLKVFPGFPAGEKNSSEFK